MALLNIICVQVYMCACDLALLAIICLYLHQGEVRWWHVDSSIIARSQQLLI